MEFLEVWGSFHKLWMRNPMEQKFSSIKFQNFSIHVQVLCQIVLTFQKIGMTGKFQIHLAIPTQVQFLQHKLIVLILLTGLNFLKLQTKWANGTCPFCDPFDFKPKFPGLFIYYVILFYLFIFFVQMANTHCTLAQGIHSSASTLLCFYMCTCKNTG